MQKIRDEAELEQLYAEAVPTSLQKVSSTLTPCYRRWIEASRFLVLTTVGPDGTDGSPRGDDGPVVHMADEKTLWLPDWRGNNRLDSLRNIVNDGRLSLMFMVPGSLNVVRVNGTAFLTSDATARAHFEKQGKQPASVIVITIGEIYFQCAKAIMRSRLWSSGDESGELPKAGDFIREFKSDFDGKSYDDGYAANAKARMW